MVTFSNKHNRKWQEPNLQHKKVYWEQGQRWVKLRICTKAIKTIEKVGLDAMAKEAGIDLWKLPFEDARPERLAYLEQNKGKVPVVSGARPRGAKGPVARSPQTRSLLPRVHSSNDHTAAPFKIPFKRPNLGRRRPFSQLPPSWPARPASRAPRLPTRAP